MLRDQKNSEMFLFVRLFKEAEVLCVPALPALPTKPNGCSLKNISLIQRKYY